MSGYVRRKDAEFERETTAGLGQASNSSGHYWRRPRLRPSFFEVHQESTSTTLPPPPPLALHRRRYSSSLSTNQNISSPPPQDYPPNLYTYKSVQHQELDTASIVEVPPIDAASFGESPIFCPLHPSPSPWRAAVEWTPVCQRKLIQLIQLNKTPH